MLETIESINNVVNNFIWGVTAMICIIGVKYELKYLEIINLTFRHVLITSIYLEIK